MNTFLSRRNLRKVPEITAIFWVIKVLTTAMGESTSDFLVRRINPAIAVAVALVALIIVLALQFNARRYIAWIYWLAVVMVAIFGTMAADVLHILLGVPYMASTAFYAIVLAIIFATWYKSEGTLSIHSIVSRRREGFYWATVLATFALGTAAGDMTASTLRLGFLTSGILFGILIMLPALAYWLLGLNEILAFWLAYILTRPLGASFADWTGKSHSLSGLGYGDGRVSLILTAAIVCLVGYVSLFRPDVKDQPQR